MYELCYRCRHYAAKALENVLAQGGAQQVSNGRIVTLSTAQRLLALADTTTADSSTANSSSGSSSSSSSSSATAAAALSHLLCHALLGGQCPLPNSSSDNNNSCSSSSSSARTANEQGAVLVAAVVRDALPALLCGLSSTSPLRAQTAWLNILNLVLLHGSSSSSNSNSDTAKPQSAERRSRPLARPLTPLTQLRAAQSLLLAHADELSRLAAAIASTGDSAVVRGKALLCIALLSAAQPSSLACACRHGVLECLRETLRALGPWLNTLSTQQQYQYQCCLQLASHCCQYTGTVLRKLAVHLHKLAPDSSSTTNSASTVTAAQRAVSASASCLPAVVAVLSSSALNSTAVSAPVIEDLGTCLALAHRHVASTAAGKRAAATPPLLDALMNVAAALCRAPQRCVLPLAAAAVAHLVPALCTLLPHSCAETRTAALTVLSSLLPALLQQQLRASVSEAAAVAAVTTDHLLPHCAHLLADKSGIQQLSVQLLLQIANCWSDAGAAFVRRKVLPQLLPLLNHNSSDSTTSVQCDMMRLLCVLVAAADQRAALELLRLGLADTLADSIQQCSSSQAFTQLGLCCELAIALLQLALTAKAQQARSPSARRVTLQASQWTELLQPLVPALPALCTAVGDVVTRGQSSKLIAVCELCAQCLLLAQQVFSCTALYTLIAVNSSSAHALSRVLTDAHSSHSVKLQVLQLLHTFAVSGGQCAQAVVTEPLRSALKHLTARSSSSSSSSSSELAVAARDIISVVKSNRVSAREQRTSQPTHAY
jgi:hypothetical protein